MNDQSHNLQDLDRAVEVIRRLNGQWKTGAEEELRQKLQRQNQLRSQLVDVSREIDQLSWQVENGVPRDPAEVIAQVLSLKQVEAVDIGTHPEINGMYVAIYTKPLTFTDRRTGHKHVGGPYKIFLRVPENGSPQFEYYSMWYRIRAFNSGFCNHPHVWGDGFQCLGNLAGDLSECLRQGDLYGFVFLSVSFLEAVNVADSAGELVYRWPFQMEGSDKLYVHGDTEIGPPAVPQTNSELEKKFYLNGKTPDEWTQWTNGFQSRSRGFSGVDTGAYEDDYYDDEDYGSDEY